MGRKTRIALQYAKKFRKSSQISVFWVYAGTVERFKNAYHEIARSLKIPGYQSPDSDILNLVKDWLESDGSGRWLMILDNADDAEIMYGSGSLRLADCLPRSDQGSILLTTRFQKVGANFTQDFLSLQSMTSVESEMLLRARLGDNSPEQNHDLYQELVKELERTPLALVQAASFMSQNCVSLDSYLQMYRQSDVSKIRLLSEDFEDDVRDSQAKNPIATTWIISFKYIKMHVPQAAELLSLMSIMDAQAIPEFLLPQGEDAISFEKALGTLEAFSFISTRKQSHGSLQHCRLFDLHRLVRLAIRNWLRLDGTLAQWTARTLKIVRSRCSQRDGNTFEVSSLVLPHAIELLASDLIRCKSSSSRHFEGNSYEPSMDDLWSLSTTVSGRTRAAVRLLEDVDTISNLMIDAAQLLYYVTMRFRDVGNYVEARSFAAKDLTIITGVYGQSHRRTLLSMDVLATILQSLGDCEHAEQLRRQYVTICEAGYGTHHVLTLEGLLHLRDFLVKRQEQEAKEIGEVALRRCKESLVLHDGNEYLKILSLLAEVQLDYGDFEEAEKCQVLALHGYQAVNDHINIIAALSSLSRIYERQDRWELAGDTQRIELDIRIRYLGRNHPSTMSAVWHLTRILLNDKKEEEAKRQATLALELMSQIYGSSSETHAHYCREFDSLFAQSSAQEQLAPSEGQFDDTHIASSMPGRKTDRDLPYE